MFDTKTAGQRLALLSVLAVATPAQAQSVPPHFLPVPDNAILSSNVVGLAVVDNAGRQVGKIKDLVVASGRFGGYILAVGGFLGLASRDVVVGPGGLTLSYDAAGKIWKARIDATADQLRAAPAFSYEGRWARP